LISGTVAALGVATGAPFETLTGDDTLTNVPGPGVGPMSALEPWPTFTSGTETGDPAVSPPVVTGAFKATSGPLSELVPVAPLVA